MDIPDSLMAAEYAICRVRMVRFGIVRKIIVLVVGQAVPVGYREASQAIDCNIRFPRPFYLAVEQNNTI
jgi:hypothetical protein